MKYKTFRLIVVAVAGLGGAVGVFFALRGCDKEEKPEETARRDPPPKAHGLKSPDSPQSNPISDVGGERPVDYDILTAAKRSLGSPKVKDAFSGKFYKVNLYQDDGFNTPNRAKVDLDRDEKWDEKWSFEDGVVKRQVAPDDDENYTEEYTLRDGKWVSGSGEAPPPTTDTPPVDEPPAAAAGADRQPLRAMDKKIVAAADRAINGKVKDAFSGESYKVNIYQDSGNNLPNRAKVDLDRDGKWDEKWNFEGAAGSRKIKRKVSPNDDDNHTIEYRLREGAWVLKK